MFSKTDINTQTDDSSLAGIIMFLIVSLALVSNLANADGVDSQTGADSQTVESDISNAQQSTSSDIHKVTSNISKEIAKRAFTPPTLDVTRVRFGEDESDSDLLVADAEK